MYCVMVDTHWLTDVFVCVLHPQQGIMLVYDVTHEKSFENIRNWIRNIEEVSVFVHVCVHVINFHTCFYPSIVTPSSLHTHSP